jgi:hypothetical protein
MSLKHEPQALGSTRLSVMMTSRLAFYEHPQASLAQALASTLGLEPLSPLIF